MSEPVYKYSYVVEATIKIISAMNLQRGDVILIGRQRAQVKDINRASNGQFAYIEIFGESPNNGSRKKWVQRYDNFYIIEKAVYRDVNIMEDDIDEGEE